MDAEFIQTRDAWQKFTTHLETASVLAISTEDSALHAYRGALCLIQVRVEGPAEGAHGAVVDVLALGRERGLPLQALWKALPAAADVVVHGGEYTIAALRQLGDPAFERLWDTQQAADLLGLPRTGYRSLASSLLGVDVPPGVACDWRHRPLSEVALESAARDVLHLPALFRALMPRIVAADLVEEWQLAGEEVRATSIDANRADPDNAWSTKEAKALPRARRALFRGLLEWRERKAREFDCPPGKVMPTRTLALLAGTTVQGLEHHLRDGFHSRLTFPDREALVHLWHALVADETDVVVAPQATTAKALTPRQTARLRALKTWRRTEAERRGVGLQAVLPATAMLHLARHGAGGIGGAPRLGERRKARYAAAWQTLLAAVPEA